MPKITIRIPLDPEDPNYNQWMVDAQGFKGPACQKTTDKLMAGLNGKVTSRRLKPEYQQVETANKVTLQR